jgi:sugar phosphate isomerase/epimerase
MRFGCCGGLDKAQEIQDAGYDYIEMGVATVKPEQADAEFEPVRDQLAELDIKPEAWNCLLPGDLKVTGPEVDGYRIERYLRTAFRRIEELGGEIVVFGSGKARSVPDDFPVDEARTQIVQFLTTAGQVAGIHGITIAIEPLNSKESNILNSVTEAVEIANAVGHPFVKVLADLYHMDEDSEPLEDIIRAGDDLVHVHTADSGRLYPGSGSYPHAEFFRLLKSIGYDERMSVECSFKDFSTECRKALDFLRKMDSKTTG